MASGTVARKSVVLAIGDIEDWIRKDFAAILLELAGDIIEDVTLFGEDRMREIIETAITATGVRRAESGGHPGRVESGDMIDSISTDIDLIGKNRIEGTFGWIDKLDPYFLYQEYGTNDIDAMRALQQAYIEAREMMLDKLAAEGLAVN